MAGLNMRSDIHSCLFVCGGALIDAGGGCSLGFIVGLGECGITFTMGCLGPFRCFACSFGICVEVRGVSVSILRIDNLFIV